MPSAPTSPTPFPSHASPVPPGSTATPRPRPGALRSGALVAALAAGLAGPLVSATSPAVAGPTPHAAHAAPMTPVARTSSTGVRPTQYPGTLTRKDVRIPMSDGTVLRGDLTLPARSDGTKAPGRFPVITTITAYNKQAPAAALTGGDAAFFARRGYAKLVVDARGTGSSPGRWCAFCAREDRDSFEIMRWAHRQRWSNGRTAMAGPSYMGINQIFAAGQRPPGLKAIFPQVPAADPYRDVVASGGQLDVGFMPLWLGLVTGAGLVPPAYGAQDGGAAARTIADHLIGATTFSAKLLLLAAAGGDPSYDGPFYRVRAPQRLIGRVNVPTFLISGEYDLFQRGTPMLFDNLRRRGIPTKMIIGPWNHLQASSGDGLGGAGYGTLQQLQLRWFDHWVKGRPDPGLRRIAPMSYYEIGSGRWRRESRWLGRDRVARTWRLSGDATSGGVRNGGLTRGTPRPGTATMLPVPVAGLCTRSTDQWTAGLVSAGGFPNPCLTDNAPNDRAGVVYQTPPAARALRFQGPLAARLYASSPTGEGMLAVAVEDVAPNGRVTRLTGGWQVIPLRRLDRRRSRYLDGRLIQPFHPFTKVSQHRLKPGQVGRVDVEVFPTGAVIRRGHRLRLAVQTFDTPHLSPTLTQVVGGGVTAVTLHNSARYPSSLTLPVRR